MRIKNIKKLKTYQIIWFIALGLLFNSCIEAVDVKNLDYESALVVEAVITNTFKTQQIKLSNTYAFDESEALPETNAKVSITNSNGETIDFYEFTTPGTYSSSVPFAAEIGNDYQLTITRSNNRSYESKPTRMPSITQIDNVYAERGSNNLDEDGMFIYVDSYDASNSSNYYRYEYEETYKIIAPRWIAEDIVVLTTDPPYSYEIQYKTTEQKTCYNTQLSNDLIFTETTDLTEDHVEKFDVRFVKSDNPIISHRYSILVKQYVLSIDAYTYYKTLKKLATSENGFAQNQPGFVQGNIYAKDNSSEKVIGIFDVSSVSEKRMFFNYRDFYLDEDLPPYFTYCEFSNPADWIVGPLDLPPPALQERILDGSVKYFSENGNYPDPEDQYAGPYTVVTAACGDCTKLGTNIKPEFWDE